MASPLPLRQLCGIILQGLFVHAVMSQLWLEAT